MPPPGRPTKFGDQFHILQAVQANGPDLAPTHMVGIEGAYGEPLIAHQVEPGPRVRVRSSPRLVTWLPADPAQSYTGHDIETVITKQVDTATHRWITSITSSNRSAIVNLWRTQCLTLPGLAVVYDFSWLSANEHTGQGLQMNEVIIENYPTPSLLLATNPNMGGQGPFFANEGDQITFSYLRHCGGPIFYLADTVNGVHEACVSPVEFFPGPIPFAHQDHGGANDRPAHYYLARHYQRIALHYNQNPRLHRTDSWSYWAKECSDAVNNPYFSSNAVTLALVNLEFDELYVRDIASGVQRQVLPFTGPGGTLDIVARAFTTNNTLEFVSGVGTFTASDIPSGYGCLAFRRSSDDFCVAILVKIFPTNDDVGAQTRLTAAEPCQMFCTSAEFAIPPGGAGDRDKQCGCSINIHTKSEKLRQKAWIGWAQYTYAGAFADLPATATEAYQDGLLDEPAWQTPPRKVITGTGFTGISGVEGPILEELR